MRKIDTSAISDTVGMPAKQGVFDHLQLAYQEILTGIAQNLVGFPFSSTNGYVLWGCVNSGSGSNFILSAGAIFYQGEVYLVDTQTVTILVSQVPVASISTSFYTNGDKADPITFTDGTPRSVLQVRKITFASGASGSTIFDYSELLTTRVDLINDQEATLGSTYTVTFDRDKCVYFASATVDTALHFDFTNARPGCVVRLKWTYGAGRALSIVAPAGSVVYQEGGDITRVAGYTNTMYLVYTGINEASQNEVGYTLANVA